tara:strand:+ start:2425 stop:2670 length:246 start_codon:yes stop_codon:yes gene_type:complete
VHTYGQYQQPDLKWFLKCGVAEALEEDHVVVCKAKAAIAEDMQNSLQILLQDSRFVFVPLELVIQAVETFVDIKGVLLMHV